MRICRLRTEALVNPTAVDEAQPRFSWSIEAEAGERALMQSACRILVASDSARLARGEADLWDSGWRETAAAEDIRYEGRALAPQTECWWTVLVRLTDGREGTAAPAYFRCGIGRWDSAFLHLDCPLREDRPLPPAAFGRTVSVREGMTRATLYITALGLYNVFFNGEEYPGLILAPEWTQFFRRTQYRALDVSGCLHAGENDLVVMVANGWYSGLWQFWPPRLYPYGTHPALSARLEIDYADGTRDVIRTDDTWRATDVLPVTFAGIYEGEDRDGRIPLPRAAEMTRPVAVSVHPELAVVAQKNEPIAVSRVLRAQSVTEPVPGVFVADFGENVAGRLRMRVHGTCGQPIEVFHNEMLNDDGTVYRDNLIVAHFVKDEDRQMLRYICRGDENGEEMTSRFTYMGFRYAEIRGLTAAPRPEEIEAEVFGSAVESSGSFRCSEEDINRLQANILRSARANFMGVPTDCPQRDERCGYTGDMQFFLPTALHNFDMEAFLAKWLVDLCEDSQLEDGSYTDHAPRFGVWSGNVAWGDAGILCPYLAYREYGNTEILRRHYDSMERYMEYLTRTANADDTRGPDFCGNGDWLHSGGGASAEIIATTYYAYTAALMAEMGHAIGREDRAAYYTDLARRIREALARGYIREDGELIGGGVTGYTLLFTMDLLPEDEALRARIAQKFTEAVEAADCRITTGFIGTPRLLPALHRIGRDDLAERLLLQRECPSWLYPVTVGATTIWERYDSWTEEKGFADSYMNSFNHFAFGSVGDYFYSGILGISLPAWDGMRTVTVDPVYLPSLTWAEGTRRVYGSRLAVAWRRENGRVRLTVSVGANLRARIRFAGETHEYGSGEYVFTEE